LLSDIKTGFRIGGLPLAMMVIAVVTTDMSQMTVSHIFTGDINASPADEIDAPSGFSGRHWQYPSVTLSPCFSHIVGC
jgi:hypothetical protein